MTDISFSKMKTYRRCPKAYDYKYNQNLKRKRPAKPLIMGSILHEMLDARSAKRNPFGVLSEYAKKYKALFREEQEMYGDILVDAERIFEGYQRFYKNEDLRYEASEELIETELADEVQFKGFIDKIAIDAQNRRWLVDHKSHRTIPDDDQRFSDLQLLFYVWAFNRENPDRLIDGVLWDYLRTKAPVIPEQLKNGQLTQRKNIDTDYHTYLAEVTRLGLDPVDYREILTQLKGEQNTFFRRVFLPTPPKVMVDQVVNDMRTTSILISRLGQTAIYRNMTKDCSSMCEFYSLCQSELRGLDSDFVRKTEFEPRKEEENGRQKVSP